MDPNSDAERCLAMAANLLAARDFMGSRTFAIRARESDPNNPISDHILAVVDTIIAADSSVFNGQPDWYAVLQLPRLVPDAALIAAHYRRLATLLSPERNRLPFADFALKLAIDAWSVLSDPTKKWVYDSELTGFLQRRDPEGNQRVEVMRFDPVGSFQQQGLVQSAPPAQPSVPPPAPPVERRQLQPQPTPPAPPITPPVERKQPAPPAPPSAPSVERRQLQPQPMTPAPAPASAAPVERRQWQQQQQPTPMQQTQEPAQNQPQPPREETPRRSEVQNMAVDMRQRVEEGRETTVEEKADVAAAEKGICNADNDKDESNCNLNVESFWTACPYCYYIYEYQKDYRDCTLRCQNCMRAFQAVQISSPPATMKGKSSSFCSWGFVPLGFSMTNWMKKKRHVDDGDRASNWVPFSPMFACPTEDGVNGVVKWFENVRYRKSGGWDGKLYGPRVYLDDDDADSDEGSEPSGELYTSDDDWRSPRHVQKGGKAHKGRKRRKSNAERGSLRVQTLAGEGVNFGDGTREVIVGLGAATKADTSVKNTVGVASRKVTRKGKKDTGKLDLNVELSNEVEDHAATVSTGNGEGDAIEGNGFFEGLDEFLSTLRY